MTEANDPTPHHARRRGASPDRRIGLGLIPLGPAGESGFWGVGSSPKHTLMA
jgi:hypothetical protein